MCEDFFNTSEIFSGTAVEQRESTQSYRGREIPLGLWTTFSVDQVYKGSATELIVVRSGAGGGDCGYRFKVGERYIVFGQRSTKDGMVGTHICSLTGEWSSERAAELDSLINSKSHMGKVFGKLVVRGIGFPNRMSPLADAKIVVSSTWSVRRGKSDAFGAFEFADLPAGDYDLRAEAPAFYRLVAREGTSTRNVVTQRFTLHPSGCVRRHFLAEENGSISGRIVAPHGLLPESVELAPISSADWRVYHSAEVDSSGTFKFEGIAQGKYVLSHNHLSPGTASTPFQPTFYPGVPESVRAGVLTLRQGEAISGLEFTVGRTWEKGEISIMVTDSDGHAIDKASVANYHDSPEFYRANTQISTAKTDVNGKATLTGFLGNDEIVRGYLNCPAGRGQIDGVANVQLRQNHSVALKLVLKGDCIGR